MVQEDKSTLTIVLGKQTISGSKSASGAYKNPNATVGIYNKNLQIDVPKGASKLILKSLFEYEEATTKKDVPNFLFALKDKNGKEIKKVLWSDLDIFYKFEEFSGELTIEIDLQKFYSEDEKVKLNFSARLECWLEESAWKPNAPQKKTASASGDADLEFDLPKVVFPGAPPEINLEILPTHSPGKDLKTIDINADWGQPYFLKLNLDNKSNNQIVLGGFDLFEDNKKIKSASLEKPLDSKWKTLVVSEDSATWVLIEDWTWYEDDILGKYKSKELSKKYYYFVTGKTIDEFGFKFDLEADEISVNVRVPDYKVNAMNLHNNVIAAEWAGLGLVVILNIALGLLIKYSKNTKFKEPKFQNKAGAGIAIEGFITGQALRALAKEVKDELKVVMDDPPKLDKNYKRIYNLPKVKYAKIAGADSLTRLFLSFINGSKKSVLQLRALRITNDRCWTAKIKKDYVVAGVQNKALSARKRELTSSFADLSKILRKLYSKVKILAKQNIVLTRKRKLRAIKQANLKQIYFSYKNVRLSRQQASNLANKLNSLSQLFSKFRRCLK